VIKSRGAKGKARVTFTVDPQVGARTAAVCGEWNDWAADADVMHRDADGGFSVTVGLEAGRASGSGTCWTVTGGTTTGPLTPTGQTTSAGTTPWWT